MTDHTRRWTSIRRPSVICSTDHSSSSEKKGIHRIGSGTENNDGYAEDQCRDLNKREVRVRPEQSREADNDRDDSEKRCKKPGTQPKAKKKANERHRTWIPENFRTPIRQQQDPGGDSQEKECESHDTSRVAI